MRKSANGLLCRDKNNDYPVIGYSAPGVKAAGILFGLDRGKGETILGWPNAISICQLQPSSCGVGADRRKGTAINWRLNTVPRNSGGSTRSSENVPLIHLKIWMSEGVDVSEVIRLPTLIFFKGRATVLSAWPEMVIRDAKSRMMGDYHVRFCERFGGEIPPYLLDFIAYIFQYQWTPNR